VDGTLALVNPVITVSNPAKGTSFAKANPAWLDAPYEVGFLVADGSFERLVPRLSISVWLPTAHWMVGST
jgi:hypothetical protein